MKRFSNQSPNFSSPQDQGRKEWRLQLYPNGDREENKDHLSMFLRLMNPQDLTINDSFSIQDEKGNCLQKFGKSKSTFTKTTSSVGYSKFCKRNDVMDKLPNDVLIVTCQFSYLDQVLENVSGTVETTSSPTSCFKQLSDDLGTLLMSASGGDEYTDVTICVGEEDKTEFKAHRNILAARSPYFSAMFRNDMREKNENRVEISNVKPEVFRDVMTFIYTGNVPVTMETESAPKEVLIAADRFALEELKILVEHFLISKINIENALYFLTFSDTHSAEILKKESTGFVGENVNEIMKTDGWKNKIGHPTSHSLANNEHIEMAESGGQNDANKVATRSTVTQRQKMEQPGSSKGCTATVNTLLDQAFGSSLPENLDDVEELTECPHLDGVAPLPLEGFNTLSGCLDCGVGKGNWICLTCYKIYCGRFINQHMIMHHSNTGHSMTLGFDDLSVWCYDCESYVDVHNEILFAAISHAHKKKSSSSLPNKPLDANKVTPRSVTKRQNTAATKGPKNVQKRRY